MGYFMVMLGLFRVNFIDDGLELIKVWFGSDLKLV